MRRIFFPYTLFYIFKEILSPFFIGFLILPILLFIIDIANSIEFFLNHDVSFWVILKIFMYILLKFLPYAIYVNILISPLIAYSSLKLNNEIFALKSLGTPNWIIALPYFLLALLSSWFVFYSLFYWSPRGVHYYNEIIDNIEGQAIAVKIKEGEFIDSFSNRVIFINKIDKGTNELKEIFVCDERDPDNPIIILAKKGRFFIKKDRESYRVLFGLENGRIYRDFYMKNWMKFNTYEFYLVIPSSIKKSSSSLEALNYKELQSQLQKKNIPHEQKYLTRMELYKRWNFVFLPIVLFLLVFSIVLNFRPRSRHIDSIGLALIIIAVYWALQVSVEALVRFQPHFLSLLSLLSFPNGLFLALSLFLYRKSLKQVNRDKVI